MRKPRFTADDEKYAKKTSKRLGDLYGTSMNARQVAAEMCMTTNSVSKTMRRHGFRVYDPVRDRRYSTDEVVALMTLRHHKRMVELKRVEP